MKYLASYSYLYLFLIAGIALASVGYSEYYIRSLFEYEQLPAHGWSSLLAWSGAGEILLSSIFAYILTCLYPANAVENIRDHQQGFELR